MRDWLVTLRGDRSQQAVADKAGISQSGYALIETVSRNPSVAMAKKIASALDFDWTRFYQEGGADAQCSH